jgi:hypothetical protein
MGMPFTDRSDLYIALNEAGINRAIRHVVRQRPSLFNYATARVIGQRSLWCRPIDVHPVVVARGNPLFTEIPAVPVLATSNAYALDAIAQLGQAAVDFFPINTLQPPAELGALPANSFAVMAELSAGLGCPRDLPSPGPSPAPAAPPVVLLPQAMTCFSLKVFGFGAAAFVGPPGNEHVQGQLVGFDTVEIEPQGLEDAIDCYVSLMIKLGILPQISVPTIRFATDLMGLVHVAIEPSVASAALPHNPAIEDDQIKVFLKTTITGIPPQPVPPGPEHGGGIVKSRTRAGAFDVVGAVSKAAVVQVFNQLLAGYKVDKSGSKSFGPFTVSYHVTAHSGGGTIDLKDDGTVAVENLDIKWDVLELCFGIDIPEVCVGGFCIIPKPFGGCLVRAPRLCAFSGNPDLQFCLELGGFIHSAVSLAVRPITKYRVDPGRTSAMNDWDADDAGVPNRWQVIASPVSIDFEIINLSATVGDLLTDAINAALDTILGPLPGWAQDLILAILGPVVDLVRRLLGIADSVEQWLIDLIGNSLGLFNLILQLMSDYLTKHPLAELPDPFPILESAPARIAVMMPIEFLGVQTTAAELVVNADIGGVP